MNKNALAMTSNKTQPDQSNSLTKASNSTFDNAKVQTQGLHSEPKSLRQSVEESLIQYFSELDGQQTASLYELFMHQVEAPLFECVMQHTQDNQSKAAVLLGLNRGTLRKKLKQYDLL
jgi:Fis family transcriptional regulator